MLPRLFTAIGKARNSLNTSGSALFDNTSKSRYSETFYFSKTFARVQVLLLPSHGIPNTYPLRYSSSSSRSRQEHS